MPKPNPKPKPFAINRTKSRCQLSDYPDSLSDDCGQEEVLGLAVGQVAERELDKLSITNEKRVYRFNVRHMARNADASFADQPEQLDSGVKRNAKS